MLNLSIKLPSFFLLVLSLIGEKALVPIISYSASSPSLTSIRNPYFFRATQNDLSEQTVPIYEDNEYGQGIMPYLTDPLQAIDTHFPYRTLQVNDHQTRVLIAQMTPSLGSRLFVDAREVGMMSEGYVWIITDGMTDYLRSLTPLVIDSMQGVLGVNAYVPKTKALENFRVRWKRKFQKENPSIVDAELNIYGLLAYDATIALALAIEDVGTVNFGLRKANVSGNHSTDLATLGISPNGPKIPQALSNTSFKDLTGDYLFVNRQLPTSAFQIVNVIGDGERELGFWTPGNGLVKKLNSKTNTSLHSTSNSKSILAPVIWPGDSTSGPKDWEIPTNGKKLRVVVKRDPITNSTTVTGYCIDVFEAVIKQLPYALTYEYIPFVKPDGESAGTYNDMVYQLNLGNFDAAVGDTTITANRSLYVDFTLPYTESVVSMIVPIRDNKSKNAWVFLKPLTWDLCVTTFSFFFFLGFVVWVLEHRINEDFRGPPSHQAGTSFWFSFSTMVFSHRKNSSNHMVFRVLILTQSYTASLTSLLTVQQLLPTVTDVNQLIRNGQHVGYQDGSFIFGILKRLDFEESKLKPYNTDEELSELSTKGIGNGGIVAAFDEAFRKGSPLVPDVSRAILNVTEVDKMKEIEQAWFGKQSSSCPDASTSVSSNSLRQVLKVPSDTKALILSRIIDLFRIFDQKEMESHAFRKSESNEVNLPPSMGAPSPRIFSVHKKLPC
ncbi:hypothetical protein P3X46_007903 [Hevea brasiliensis]|uniref:Ionotropic glutamate receptor C-terminal domain-containing protein n=1 Tax=Hevea brasiliensis TaxID=3981 RepID=A0ABQ9MV14_HEVBR|nr:hypothetical protein P3X46_007903 [Hevea brasiliensis]